MACEAAPQPKCENYHIVANNIKEKKVFERLLQDIATHFITAITTRQELESKYLQPSVRHLEAKLEIAKAKQSKNTHCLEELQIVILNCLEKKLLFLNGSLASGCCTEENLNEALRQAKEEADCAVRSKEILVCFQWNF